MGNNGDLADGGILLIQCGNQGMTHFVVSHQPLFHIAEDSVLLLAACDDSFKGDQQVFLVDSFPIMADSPQGCFVYKICKVGTYCAGSCLGNLVQVHIFSQFNLSGVDFQGIQTALEVRTVHYDPAVKTAGTQQRFVQNFGAVGGGKTYNTLVGVKTVNFSQQLVQGLFLLGVAAVTAVTRTAHCVDFVNEDDAGSNLGSFFEEISDAACTHTYEHLHKVGAGDGEERHICFTGNGFCKEGLAGTGRAYQQSTLRQLCADFGVFVGIMQKVNDLLQRFFGFVLSCHILKGNAGLLFHIDFGLGFAEAAHHTLTAHAFAEHPCEQEDSAEHQYIIKNGDQEGIVFHNGPGNGDTHGIQSIAQSQRIAAGGQTCEAGFLRTGRLGRLFFGHIDDPVMLDFHFLQILGVHFVHKIRVGGFCILAAAYKIKNGDHCQQNGDTDKDRHPYVFWLFIVPIRFLGGIVAFGIHILPP